MDDLRGRFHRLDRITAPNLWNEAVGRAAELDMPSRRAFTPAMGLVAVALLLAALAGTIAVGAWLDRPPEIRATVTYDNGLIASVHECGRVVAVDPSSLAQRDLAAGSDCEFGAWSFPPAWSSDGSRLAWMSASEGPEALWVHEPGTGESRQLEPCLGAGCGDMDISPDGSLVAYATNYGDGTAGLVVVDVASGESSDIELISMPRTPRFSPDGSQIAMSVLGGRSGIYLVDVGGDGQLGDPTLLGGIIDADQLAWSPDGSWIAYRHYGRLAGEGQTPLNGQVGPTGFGIVITRVDGSETRVLATGPADTGPQWPTWAPDSGSLAYATIKEDGPGEWSLELWTVDIGDGGPTSVFQSGCCKEGFGAPSWSPDGEWIAFSLDMVDDPARTGTFLIRPDGSDLRRVSEEPLEPVWQPIPRD